MAEDFFRRFDEEMQRRYPQAVAADAALEQNASAPAAPGRRMPLWVWVLFAAVVLLALLLLVRR
jgi:type VI protein secretion system component VasF